MLPPFPGVNEEWGKGCPSSLGQGKGGKGGVGEGKGPIKIFLAIKQRGILKGCPLTLIAFQGSRRSARKDCHKKKRIWNSRGGRGGVKKIFHKRGLTHVNNSLSNRPTPAVAPSCGVGEEENI